MKLSFRLLIVFVAFIAQAAVATPALAAGPTILVFGDSLSAAYRMPQEQGWVSLLQQRLKTEGFPYQVVNASVSGETTSGGLSRLPITLRQHRPDIVLLELGANDGLRGLPLAQMRKNLETMIKTSKDFNAKVVLLGIKIPPNYGPTYTREFSQSFKELAAQYDLPLVDFFLDGVAGKPQFTLDDGLHPTSSAQPYILNNIWPVLRPELDTKLPSAAAR
ncbi:MAG TPA: arylesterase [Methylophilaceae bacterium]|nr:arylesterase [Methylophilaceae bacterium]